MIERDRFAFAALSCLMQSEGDSEVIHDTAKANDTAVGELYAKLAYQFGDAMHRHSVQEQVTADVVTYPDGTGKVGE